MSSTAEVIVLPIISDNELYMSLYRKKIGVIECFGASKKVGQILSKLVKKLDKVHFKRLHGTCMSFLFYTEVSIYNPSFKSYELIDDRHISQYSMKYMMFFKNFVNMQLKRKVDRSLKSVVLQFQRGNLTVIKMIAKHPFFFANTTQVRRRITLSSLKSAPLNMTKKRMQSIERFRAKVSQL